jgi:predicted nucleotidyltransferase
MGGGGGGARSSSGGPTDLDALRERAREIAGQATFDAEVNDRLAQRFASINARDTEKIGRYLDDIVAALTDDIDGVERTLFGGSVAKSTYVEGLSDVDALVVLDRADLKDATPEQVREQFCRSLKAQLSHADVADVSSGVLAVTVSYHDGTQIQLLPAVQRGERLAISSADGKEWKTIHPRSFARRLTEINKRQGGAAVPAIKLAKQVIGSQLPDGEHPSGYHVEALAVQAFGDYVGSRNPKALLTHFFASAARGVLQPIKDMSGQSLHVDDSLGDAQSADRQRMSGQLQRIADTMQNSRDIREWERLLGDA